MFFIQVISNVSLLNIYFQKNPLGLTHKLNSFSSREKTELSSFNPVDIMPGAKISGLIPGGICPR